MESRLKDWQKIRRWLENRVRNTPGAPTPTAEDVARGTVGLSSQDPTYIRTVVANFGFEIS